MLRRFLVIGAIAASPLLATFAVTPALASGIPAECGISEHCIVDYYYDAAHTQLAGTLALPCSGAIFSSGDTDTPYYVVHEVGSC